MAQIARSSLPKSISWRSRLWRNFSVNMQVERLANAGHSDAASSFPSFERLVLFIGNGNVRPVEAPRAEEKEAGGDSGESLAPDQEHDAQLRRGSPPLM